LTIVLKVVLEVGGEVAEGATRFGGQQRCIDFEERYLEIYTELGGVRYRSESVVESSFQRH
jgi:hypothetical protein